ncbi:MAG TPA: PH domain-containing protein [Gemmatimonadaceae bacterium]|nr:PH domain-containing protein [Gemmatimonadaceae bacterium]
MSTPSDRRLHPASPVFELIEGLKQFLLPLVILLFTGRGDRNEFISMAIVAVIALRSIITYFTYRFRIDDSGVEIRSGVIFKSTRNIPFDRIQNVTLKQSIVHRIFGVADVQLESAGGTKAEGTMRVLSLDDAHALEATVRERSRRAAPVAEGVAGVAVPGTPYPLPDSVPPQTLLALEIPDLLRLGLTSNRALVLAIAGIGIMLQFNSEEWFAWLTPMLSDAFGSAGEISGGQLVFAIAVLVLIVLFIAMLASVVITAARYHEFVLTDDGKRLRVERGLLTRLRAALQRRRIQAFTIDEGLMHRFFKRRGLRVDSAGVARDQERSLRDLVPIAEPAKIDEIVAHLLAPRASWPVTSWRSLHPAAWRREFVRPVIWSLLLSIGGVLWFGEWGLAFLALIPIGFIRARVWARYAAYAEENGVIAVREGWLRRTWRFAEVRKLQVLSMTETPFDRRAGMATLHLDTAGASADTLALRIRYLPRADAVALRDKLATAIA